MKNGPNELPRRRLQLCGSIPLMIDARPDSGQAQSRGTEGAAADPSHPPLGGVRLGPCPGSRGPGKIVLDFSLLAITLPYKKKICFT